VCHYTFNRLKALSSAGPVIARLAKAMGALTIGIVTEPFAFEGLRRAREAKQAVEVMRHAADTVVVVPNDRLLETVEQETSMLEAFQLADDVLRQVCCFICIEGTEISFLQKRIHFLSSYRPPQNHSKS